MSEYDLTIHPLAERFPEMPTKDFEELKESIRKYGLFEPIVVNEKGQILDGRHRYRAICELESYHALHDVVTFNYIKGSYDLTEEQFIFDANIHRRHLTQTQIAALCVEFLPVFEKEKERVRLANLKQSTEGATVALSIPKGKASDLAGKQAGVSGRLIRRVKAIKERSAKRFDELRRGTLQIRDAEHLVYREDTDERHAKQREEDRLAQIEYLKTHPPAPPRPARFPPPPQLTPEEEEELSKENVVIQFQEVFVSEMCRELDLPRETLLAWVVEVALKELAYIRDRKVEAVEAK